MVFLLSYFQGEADRNGGPPAFPAAVVNCSPILFNELGDTLNPVSRSSSGKGNVSHAGELMGRHPHTVIANGELKEEVSTGIAFARDSDFFIPVVL